VFFANTEYIDNDAVFGVRNSLIAELKPFDASAHEDLTLTRKPDAQVNFDFVLAPE